MYYAALLTQPNSHFSTRTLTVNTRVERSGYCMNCKHRGEGPSAPFFIYPFLSCFMCFLKSPRGYCLHSFEFLTMSNNPHCPRILNNVITWTAFLEVKHAYTTWESGRFWSLESYYRQHKSYYKQLNSHQGETQVQAGPCLPSACPSPPTQVWCGCDRATGLCSAKCRAEEFLSVWGLATGIF